jgi:hypothetical protein
MRLVSVASMAGTAALVGVPRAAGGETRKGSVAPALFLGTGMVTEIGGRLQIDPLLARLHLGAASRSTRARDRGSARAHALRAGVATGFAALAKGPPAVVGLVALAWRFLPSTERTSRLSRREARSPRPRRAARARLGRPPSLREPTLWGPLFFGQHLGRAREGTQHPGPPWKFLPRPAGVPAA